MDSLRLIRKLRLTDVEVWMVKRGFGPPLCWLVLVDAHRPSTLADYPHLQGIEDESDFGDDNYIRAIFLHPEPLEPTMQETMTNLVEDLLEGNRGCSWSGFFEPLEAEESEVMRSSFVALLAAIERVLKRHGFSPVPFAELPERRLSHLSQA